MKHRESNGQGLLMIPAMSEGSYDSGDINVRRHNLYLQCTWTGYFHTCS
jgi:hypothetical protein